MSIKSIDINNPILLLDPYSIQEKTIKKSVRVTLPAEDVNVSLWHLNSVFIKADSESLFTGMHSFIVNTTKFDVIHSTVGLFDTCLPDMDLDTIYNSIVDKEAYTIIAFSSPTIALGRLIKNLKSIKNKSSKIESIQTFLNDDKFNQKNNLKGDDIYSAAEEREDEFKLVFNDDDSSDDGNEEIEDDSNDDETDFSLGYNQYIQNVYKRKLSSLLQDIDKITEIGFENQIIGAISFKIRYVDVRKVVHITMMGILKDYRSRGLGKYLINLVLNPKIVGQYDAVVVHADFSACDFFKKFGFSDDALLNIQWHSLEPEYTNCSLLTYLSAYSSRSRHNEILAEEFSTAEMEADIKLWQQRSTDIHCFQFQVFQKLKMEIEYLKQTIKSQDSVMKTIMKELRDSTREKLRLEKLLETKSKSEHPNNILISELKITAENRDLSEDVESRVKSHFHESVKMVGQQDFIRYVDFVLADVLPLHEAEYRAIKRSLELFSPRLATKSQVSSRVLYFCESFSLSKDAKLKILSEGFDKTSRKPGSHGIGHYFASNPATAAIYASSNSVIVVEALLGNICRNVTETQCLKESAPEGYDSVLVASSYIDQIDNKTPKSEDHSYFYSQEFVVFDHARILPLGMLTYSISSSD